MESSCPRMFPFLKTESPVNGFTVFDTADSVLIGRSSSDRFKVAWASELGRDDACRLEFAPAGENDSVLEEWEQSPVISNEMKSSDLSLRHLLDVAQHRHHLRAGDV